MFSWFDRLQPVGSLLMRIVLGAIMIAHGYSKIIPRGALYNFTHFAAHLGMPAWLGYVAAFTEFFGGILLVLGRNGQPGFEFPLALFAIALMLVFTGAGVMAIDNVYGRGTGKVRRI